MSNPTAPHVAIIGGGPAGLMAADVLSRAGMKIDLYDAMPSLGRKFLLAGIGGLNITHSESYAIVSSRCSQRLTAFPLAPCVPGCTNWAWTPLSAARAGFFQRR